MSALLICVAAWFALNAVVFAVLILRPDRRAGPLRLALPVGKPTRDPN
jgi:hypothetical protein